MKALLLAAIACLTVACAPVAEPGAKLHQQWHLTIVAPVALQAQALAAAEEWNSALGREVFIADGDVSKGAVYFREGTDAEMDGAGGWTLSDDGRTFIVLVHRDCFASATTFRHELGHVLGLDDASDESDVMNWHLTGADIEISDADVSGVYAFYGWNEQARDF